MIFRLFCASRRIDAGSFCWMNGWQELPEDGLVPKGGGFSRISFIGSTPETGKVCEFAGKQVKWRAGRKETGFFPHV